MIVRIKDRIDLRGKICFLVEILDDSRVDFEKRVWLDRYELERWYDIPPVGLAQRLPEKPILVVALLSENPPGADLIVGEKYFLGNSPA